MNQPQDLPGLLDRLKHILSTQSLPQPSASTIPVLPPSIPALPPATTTLPLSAPPDPLTHLTTLLTTHILPYLNFSSLSPHYYGFVIGGATPAALLADLLVSIYDQNVHVHLPSETLSTSVEVAALNLLIDLFGLPRDQWGVGTSGQGGGVFTTGATASNTLGLAVGREWVVAEAVRRKTGRSVSVGEVGLVEGCAVAGVRGIKVLSSMPHSSVVKAAAGVGIGRANVVDVGTEGDPLRVDLGVLEEMTGDDGFLYILAISAGEVNTGMFATDGVEMMRRIREICDRRGIWIHVDAAFGLFGRVLMNAENRANYGGIVKGVEGLELADSITGDGHKLLNVPYDCGLFFTRHKQLNEDVFQNGSAAYLKTPARRDGGPVIQSPLNLGIENSRRFRALPVWATLMTYGVSGYVDMLQRQIGLARKVVDWMWDQEAWEVLPKRERKSDAIGKTFMVVLFRAKDENINRTLVKTINATGYIYVSGTQWDGTSAARIAISNWQVDVERDFVVIQQVLKGIIA